MHSQGPYDPHQVLIEWDLQRWVEGRYHRDLSPEARQALRRQSRPSASGAVQVLAPFIALAIIGLSAFIASAIFGP